MLQNQTLTCSLRRYVGHVLLVIQPFVCFGALFVPDAQDQHTVIVIVDAVDNPPAIELQPKSARQPT